MKILADLKSINKLTCDIVSVASMEEIHLGSLLLHLSIDRLKINNGGLVIVQHRK